MKKQNSLHSGFVMTVILIFVSTLLYSPNVSAGWDDNSDDLPGMSSTTEVIIFVGVAVAAVVLVRYLLKNSKDKDAAGDTDAVSPDSTHSNLNMSPRHLKLTNTIELKNLVTTERRVDVKPFLGIRNFQKRGVFGNSGNWLEQQSVVAGVDIRF